MSLTLVGASDQDASFSGTTDLAPDAGTQAGDLLLAAWTDAQTAPAGYQLLGYDTLRTGPRSSLALSYRVATATSADHVTSSDKPAVSLATYHGALGAPYAALGTSAEAAWAAGTFTMPGAVALPIAGSLIALWAVASANQYPTMSGFTQDHTVYLSAATLSFAWLHSNSIYGPSFTVAGASPGGVAAWGQAVAVAPVDDNGMLL